jgi:UrcA family protein
MFNPTLSALAAAMLAAGTVAVSSAPANAAEFDQASVTVQVGDLDLTSAQGAARLDRRVRYAARQICGPVPALDLKMKSMVLTCQRDVVANAQADVQLAHARSASRIARLALRLR